MSPEPVPDATPPPLFTADAFEDDEELVWRNRNVLVLSRDGSLDDRCIKCGAPTAGERVMRHLHWHPPMLYLTILLGVVIYVVLALLVRKEVTVFFGVCPAHRRQHWQRVAIAWSAVVAGLALVFTMSLTNGWVAFGGLVLLLFGLVYAATQVPYLRPRRIEDELSWIVGCSREYLAPLPELK